VKKKHAIVRAACRLFADQGFEATTTLQISREAQATEPLIFYHFKGKDDLFTSILAAAFAEYFNRFDALLQNTAPEFKKIENLIDMHIAFVEALPHEIKLILSTCPARLRDPDHICAGNYDRLRERNRSYLIGCLSAGIESGEFRKMPVSETASLLMALINGLVRQQSHNRDNLNGVREAAVSFCRFSLVNP